MRAVAALVPAVLAAALVPSRPAAAQDTTRTTPAADSAARRARAARLARCDSVLRTMRADTTRVLVNAYLLTSEMQPASRELAGLLTQELAGVVRLPSPLQLPVFSPGPLALRAIRPPRDTITPLRAPALSAMYGFTMYRDGRLQQPTVLLSSFVRGFDESIVRALDSLGRARRVPIFGDDFEGDSARLLLRISTLPQRGPAFPLFTGIFPRLPLVDAAPLPTNRAPAYPAEERAAGVEGRVLLRLIVESEGAPAAGTVEMLQATTAGFGDAALRALVDYRFTPAQVAGTGCAVPQIVQLPMVFVPPY